MSLGQAQSKAAAVDGDAPVAQPAAEAQRAEVPAGVGPEPDGEATDAVKEFCAVTGAEPSTALVALAQSGGDLEGAMGLFFDHWDSSMSEALAAQAAHGSSGHTASDTAGAGAGGHAGEWRCITDGSLDVYCKTDAGDAGTHICAHAAGVIDASHWSCCGVLTQAAPCGGVRSAAAPVTLWALALVACSRI